MVPLDLPAGGFWSQELQEMQTKRTACTAEQITKYVPTEAMIQRSGRDTCSTGCLWDDIVEYKILRTWKRSILHFCVPKDARQDHISQPNSADNGLQKVMGVPFESHKICF